MKPGHGTALNPLFDIELDYIEGMKPVMDQGKVGTLIGSGRGRLLGPSLYGDVAWTLFEAQGHGACESNLVGKIQTDDGAGIEFDSMGFFLRREGPAAHKWVASAAVKFETRDPRYGWLNEVLGLWHGEFDMQTHRHRYRVWAAQDRSLPPETPAQ